MASYENETMNERGAVRPVISIPQTRVRREFRSISRRDLPRADVQVTRCGAPAVMLVSPERLAELDELKRQLTLLKGEGENGR